MSRPRCITSSGSNERKADSPRRSRRYDGVNSQAAARHMSLLDYARPRRDERPDFTIGPIGNWLGWAVYLGMSWTWCIGMFLPVLLVREFGVWGWVVFAIPNVIGAAAMGWIISRERSHQIVQQHRAAVEAFSVITIAFQLFFLFWLF